MINKKTIAAAFFVFLLLAIGGFFFFRRASSENEKVEIIPTPTVVLPTVSQDVKVDLTPQNANREVLLTISNIPEETESIEYELTYETSKGLPRGVLGKITIEDQKSIEREITLGTCSSGRCVYDQGVEKIDLSLKFNSKDKASIFRKTYTL